MTTKNSLLPLVPPAVAEKLGGMADDITDAGKAVLTAPTKESICAIIGAASVTKTTMDDLTAAPTMEDFNKVLAVLREASVLLVAG